MFGALTFTTLGANSADDKLIFFLFIPVNRIWHFMQIVTVNIYHSLDKLSRWQTDDIFLIYPSKQDLTFHANCDG